MSLKARYFIAIVPDEPTLRAVEDIKLEFAQKYNSKASLRSPPHITLHMPFQLQEKKEAHLQECLNQITSHCSPFDLTLNGFGHFGERVLYINVERTVPLDSLYTAIASSLKKSLNIFNSDYKNRGYNPHMTVAFRDLKKEMFREAWARYSKMKFTSELQVNSICLLKHDGKRWHEHYKASFG